jgi:hypothetical protein
VGQVKLGRRLDVHLELAVLRLEIELENNLKN